MAETLPAKHVLWSKTKGYNTIPNSIDSEIKISYDLINQYLGDVYQKL
jgi:hypothetical protein